MKLTKIICVVLVLCTVFSMVSCTSKKESNEGSTTTPGATTPEQTTPEQTTPEQTTPEQTTPEQTTPEITVDPAETYVIPADGKISLGDGENGISYPFSAGVLTGLSGDNYAVAAMNKLNEIKYFTKVVTPIGGFIGNWMLTNDSKLDMFTAGNYGDIQMFYHTDESNWVFGPGTSKGQVIIIKFTAPADGTYSYTVTGRDWTAASSGAVMDVHVGENMHNWWDMFRFAGKDHSAYAGQQTSSTKELTKGTNVYFIIRATMDTISAVSEFVINYTPAE
jgi:hypothetical protein